MSWFRWEGGTLILNLRIQPRASRDEIVGPHGEEVLKLRITAPPVEGKANAHLMKFLAKTFGVGRSAIELVSGETAREKRVRITAPTRFPAGLEFNQR